MLWLCGFVVTSYWWLCRDFLFGLPWRRPLSWYLTCLKSFRYRDQIKELMIVMVSCMYSQHVTLSTFSLISLLTATLSKARYSLFVRKAPLNPDQWINLGHPVCNKLFGYGTERRGERWRLCIFLIMALYKFYYCIVLYCEFVLHSACRHTDSDIKTRFGKTRTSNRSDYRSESHDHELIFVRQNAKDDIVFAMWFCFRTCACSFCCLYLTSSTSKKVF